MGGMTSQVIWNQRWDEKGEATLKQALSNLQELPSQRWDFHTTPIVGVRDVDTSYVAPAATDWSSILLHLNSLIGNSLAAELSRLISGTAIVFLEYEQETWGYALFQKGTKLDEFWSVPEYVEEDPTVVRGNPILLSKAFNISESNITPYLRHFSIDEQTDEKAFDDDEFALRDHWVRVDFMRRLGLKYPEPAKAASYIHIIKETPFRAPQAQSNSSLPPSQKKAWWHFWK